MARGVDWVPRYSLACPRILFLAGVYHAILASDIWHCAVSVGVLTLLTVCGHPVGLQTPTGPEQVFFAIDEQTAQPAATSPSPPSGTPQEPAAATPTSSGAESQGPTVAGGTYVEDGSVIPFDRPGGQSEAHLGVPNPLYQE